MGSSPCLHPLNSVMVGLADMVRLFQSAHLYRISYGEPFSAREQNHPTRADLRRRQNFVRSATASTKRFWHSKPSARLDAEGVKWGVVAANAVIVLHMLILRIKAQRPSVR